MRLVGLDRQGRRDMQDSGICRNPIRTHLKIIRDQITISVVCNFLDYYLSNVKSALLPVLPFYFPFFLHFVGG
jgi:hypothetical protein